MAYLVDTSILARLANTADIYYAVAAQAVVGLHRRGELLRIAPQNLVEFRSVATRPTVANGLGLSSSTAETIAATFEATFPILDETPEIYPAWKEIMRVSGVSGKQVHDARLAAVCHIYRITHILTFNVQHFARFTGVEPGLVVVDPISVRLGQA